MNKLNDGFVLDYYIKCTDIALINIYSINWLDSPCFNYINSINKQYYSQDLLCETVAGPDISICLI